MPGVECVFVAHSHPSSPSFVPGHSDLDLTILFSDDAAEDPLTIRKCGAAIERLSRLFSFVWPQDVRFTARGELIRYLTSLGPPGLLHHPGDWLLIAGQDVREEGGRYIAPHRIPWHPEFNTWWANLLQSKILAPSDGGDARYLRIFYRAALKSQLLLRDAMGRLDQRPPRYIEDGQPMGTFVGDPDLAGILEDLKARNFWARNRDHVQSRILLAILRSVGEFYSTCKVHPQNVYDRAIVSHSAEEPHKSHYAELERRIQGQPELIPVLEAAMAYPVPHWHPYEYQVDLVLRDGLPQEEFAAAIHALKRGFGGRTFAVGMTQARITIALKSIYRHPLYFLGFPFPFLREHIQEYGALIYGSPVDTIGGTFSRADLIEWCRLFFPFHMFTFRRRSEHASPEINIHQLASLRLFLETGEIVTDVPRIHRAYLDRFVTDDRDRAVLSHCLHRAPAPAASGLYTDAFAFISREYDRLESLVMEPDGPRAGHLDIERPSRVN
jgi:hypothetical protein